MRISGVFMIVATLLVARSAYADGPAPIAVLPTQTLDALDQGDGLTSALKRAIESTPGYSLADGDWSRPDVLIMSLQCGSDPENPPSEPDAECESKIADRLKVDRFVWATLAKSGANVKGAVHFYQRGKPSGAGAPIEYTENLTSGADPILLQIARAALKNAGGGAPVVHFHVDAGTESGDAFIDGELVGKIVGGKGDLDAPAGPHKLLMKLPDGRKASSDVNLAPDGKTSITLAVPSPPPGFDAKLPIGIGAIAVGAGLVIGGVVGTVQFRTDQTELNAYGKNPCANTAGDANRDLLCKNRTQKIVLQAVAYPLGAALAITGSVLLAKSDFLKKPARSAVSLELTPFVGPGGGFVSLEGQY